MAAPTLPASAVLAPIAKAAQYAVGAAILLVATAATDGAYTTQEVVSIALAFFGTFLVYVPALVWVKKVVATVIAVLEFVQLHLTTDGGLGDFGAAQVWQIVIIVGVGLGVFLVPNRGTELHADAIDVAHRRVG